MIDSYLQFTTARLQEHLESAWMQQWAFYQPEISPQSPHLTVMIARCSSVPRPVHTTHIHLQDWGPYSNLYAAVLHHKGARESLLSPISFRIFLKWHETDKFLKNVFFFNLPLEEFDDSNVTCWLNSGNFRNMKKSSSFSQIPSLAEVTPFEKGWHRMWPQYISTGLAMRYWHWFLPSHPLSKTVRPLKIF